MVSLLIYHIITVFVICTTVHNVAGQTYCATDKGCSNKGTCDNGFGCTKTCTCPVGFLSPDCFLAVNCTTAGNECGSNGKCVGGNCQCDTTKGTGRFCTLPPISPVCTATNNNCGAHGVCNTTCGRCLCFDGYTGTYCRDALYVGVCKTDKGCNDHGTCQKGDTCDSTCDCKDGYWGRNCHRVPRCTANGNQCGNHGSCIPNTHHDQDESVCLCTDGYWGENCEKAPCTLAGFECLNGGECIDCNADNPRCQCRAGFYGDRCENAPVCTEHGNECKNGGKCNLNGGIPPYSCTCLPEFMLLGPRCGGTQLTIFMSSLFSPVLVYLFSKQ